MQYQRDRKLLPQKYKEPQLSLRYISVTILIFCFGPGHAIWRIQTIKITIKKIDLQTIEIFKGVKVGLGF